MTVLVARTTTPESKEAVRMALVEADRRREDLVIFDLDGEPTEGGRSDVIDGVEVTYSGHDPRNRSAAGELVEAAARMTASVLVIGIRHRSPVGKLLLGSNAQEIILDSPVPVLAVKAPRT